MKPTSKAEAYNLTMLAGVILGLWLQLHRYTGIVRGSILYIGEGLAYQ